VSGRGRSLEGRIGVAALIMGGGVLLSRLTGHAREAILLAVHGAGSATDAYYAAFTLPDLLNYMLAGGALSIAFLPIFAEFVARNDEAGGWRVFSTVATTMTLVMAGLVLVAELAAPALVPLLVPGFDGQRLAQTVRLTRIVMPAQLAFYLGGLVQATLYAREVFWAPALSPLIYNLAIILSGGVVLRHLGVEGFAWGVLVGAFLGPLGLPLLASRRHIRYRFHLSFRDPALWRFVKLSLPLMLGFSLLSVDQWLSRYFASGQVGSITHLDNARRLMLVPTAVLGQAAGMAALPYLTKLDAAGRHEEMGRVLGVALRRVLEITIAAACLMAVLAPPIVRLVFGWGKNTPADVSATASLLVIFAVGIPAWGLQGIAARGFYARHDTLTPMWVSSLIAGLSVPLYWALSRALGPLGLALSTTLGMAGTAVATLAALRWRGVPLRLDELLGTGLRAGVATAVAGGACWVAAVWGLGRWLRWDNPLHAVGLLAVGSAVFIAVLLGLAGPLKLEGVWAMVRRVRQRLGS